MGKSAKFFKRPTRKEKQVLSLTKGDSTSLFDAATSSDTKTILSKKANAGITKKSTATASSSSSSSTAGTEYGTKASLAYKLQMNGGVKAAIKDLEELNDEDEDEEEDDEDDNMGEPKVGGNKKKDMDKTKPRADYVELMYGKQQTGNKRKTFKPKPALIK